MNEDAVFLVCATVLIILCAGEPDLIDALVHLLRK